MNNKISKLEICKAISTKTKISQKQIVLIWNEIFDQIKIQLQTNKTLTIKNFGRLKLSKHQNSYFNECKILTIKKSKKGWKNE